jgi:hypothetical protein
MLLRAKRYVRRRISRSLGIEMLADKTESLREQISALREDVSNLSAAINSASANIALVYDCLIEFDRERRLKPD